MNPTVTETNKANCQVIILSTANARAEIWPTRGFNCVTWQIRKPDGSWGDILYSAPDWETNPVPTRSGNPILFPFPNRLAGGRMDFLGKPYQLPLTEATKTHAIHGFSARVAWTIVGSGTKDQSAFITAKYQIQDHWPGMLAMSLKYTLTDDSLSLDATIENHGDAPSPYGLGYHAYFRHPLATPDQSIDSHHFECQTDHLWVCDNNIPTGQIIDTPAELNFKYRQPLGSTHFDTLLSGIATGDACRVLASLTHPDQPGRVTVSADESFPFLVLFTAPHRRAIAIEPYTCATNAANMPNSLPHQWRFLCPGMKNHHLVKYHWRSET